MRQITVMLEDQNIIFHFTKDVFLSGKFCEIQNDGCTNLQGTRENAVYGHFCVQILVLCREGGRSPNRIGCAVPVSEIGSDVL